MWAEIDSERVNACRYIANPIVPVIVISPQEPAHLEVNMPFGLQPWHIIAIAVAALIIFGPKRLPEIGHGLGKALNEFRRGTKEMTDSFRDEMRSSDQPQTPVQSMPQPVPMQTISQPVQAPTLDSGNFCVHCGAPNPAEARFCNKCGTQLPSPQTEQ